MNCRKKWKLYLEQTVSPGWCGSVDWAPACKLMGHRFNSLSGHMLGLGARSLVGGIREATTHWYFSSFLSLFLPLSLKINKEKKRINFIVILLLLSQFFQLFLPTTCSHSQSPHHCPCPWVIHTYSLSSPFPFSHHYSVLLPLAAVSLFPVSMPLVLFCLLDSCYTWGCMVFVFHQLAYYT